MTKDTNDADFVTLARNALDVMMRRGPDWITVYPCDSGKLAADCDEFGWIPGEWDDPFTVWVEADKWYCENVEAKGEQV